MKKKTLALKAKGMILFFQILLLLSFVNSLFSQTFEKVYKTDNHDIAYDAVEFDDSYIIPVNSGNFFENNYTLKYLKLNKEGKIIDSLDIITPNDYGLIITQKTILLSDSTMLSINVLENNFEAKSLQFTQVTKNLDIVYDTILDDTVTTRKYFDFVLDNDNNIVCIGYNIVFEEFFISVYDIYGNNLGYNVYTNTQTGYLPSTIIDIPERNVYHMFIYWSTDEYFFEINKETLQIDAILNYPNGFLPRNAVKGIDNNSYFIAGTQNSYLYNGVRKLSFVENDNFGDSINQYSYLISPDTNTFYSYNSFSIYNNIIYFGGTYNFTATPQFPFLNEYRWIFINKLNPDGSIIWQRFYKGDANYVPYKVLATTDGGALILTTKYDWNDPIPYQRDLHILKVDSTGWYEGLTTGETEYDRPKQILVYPNPAKDKVNFVTGFYNNLNLKIYNLQGEEVLSKLLPYSQTIDVSNLHKGTYIYILTGEKGFVEKGKLIKE